MFLALSSLTTVDLGAIYCRWHPVVRHRRPGGVALVVLTLQGVLQCIIELIRTRSGCPVARGSPVCCADFTGPSAPHRMHTYLFPMTSESEMSEPLFRSPYLRVMYLLILVRFSLAASGTKAFYDTLSV